MRCNPALVLGWPIPGVSHPQLGVGSTGAQITREQRSFRQLEHNMPNMLFPVKGKPNRIPHLKGSDYFGKPLGVIWRVPIHFDDNISTEQKLLSGNGDRQITSTYARLLSRTPGVDFFDQQAVNQRDVDDFDRLPADRLNT